jgi:anti-sigma-K factor RskA
MMDRETLLSLIPAYALGALDPEECAEFEAWLATDAEAQALLADYRATADRLVITTPSRTARPGLAAELYDRLVAQRPAPAPARPARRGRRILRYALPLAAAVAAVIAAIILLVSGREGEALNRAAQMYNDIMAQDGARSVAVAPTEDHPSVNGWLAISPTGTRAVIQVMSLPALSEDQAFQLWMREDDGTVRSGGVFRTDHPEEPLYIQVPIDDTIDGYAGFGVSIEPAGGSPFPDKPTGPPVFRIPLKS